MYKDIRVYTLVTSNPYITTSDHLCASTWERERERVYFRNFMPHVANMYNFGRLSHFLTTLQNHHQSWSMIHDPWFPFSKKKKKTHSRFLTWNKSNSKTKLIHMQNAHSMIDQHELSSTVLSFEANKAALNHELQTASSEAQNLLNDYRFPTPIHVQILINVFI